MTLHLLESAERELDDVVAELDAQLAGLGAAFFKDILHAFQRIERSPHTWAVVGKTLHRYRLGRFPYSIFYTLNAAEVLIVAIGHRHRHPVHSGGA